MTDYVRYRKGAPILRIEIAGNWRAEDFSGFFDEIDHLYNLAAYTLLPFENRFNHLDAWWRLDRRRRDWYEPISVQADLEFEVLRQRLDVRQFLAVSNRPSGFYPLQVKAIDFASPGFSDFFGFAEALSKVSDFVLGVTDRILMREDRGIDREKKRQEVLGLKLDNAKKLLELGDATGLDKEQKERLLRDALGVDHAIEGRLINGQVKSVTYRPRG